MPGKSRHGKGKHPRYSKKSRATQRHGTMALQHVAADTSKPAATISVPPSPRTPTSPATLRTAPYPYITTELLRIGILTGIVVVILVVLAVVLS